MNYIDRKYALLASPYLKGWTDIGKDTYNFRCPYCGDSKRNSHKRRGYLFENKDHVVFKCHNCGMVCGLSDFLNTLSSELANSYRYEKFVEPKKRTLKQRRIDFKMEQTFESSEKSETVPWKTLLSLPENHHARLYIDSRRIPSKSQERLGYVEDFNLVYQAFDDYKDKSLKTKMDAIIIPFYDESHDLTYIQARFFEEKFRYITIQTKPSARKIYGLDTMDLNKRVWVFEGPFDSMFLENSIACAGSSSMLADTVEMKNTVLVFDRDYMVNYEVFTQMRKAVNNGRSIVLYDERFKYNDANAAIQSGWSIEQLEKYFTERTFTGLSAQLELTRLKPPRKK